MNKQPLILLLTDFSEASYEAFAPTVELAKRLGGRIVLLHVVRELVAIPHGAPLAPPLAMPAESHDALMKEARADMEKALAKFEDDVPLSTEVLSAAEIHDEIARYAEKQSADFIALATHGRTGIRRVLMGSAAESILRHSQIPVVAFPLAHRS